MKLMLISQLVITRSKFPNRFIMLVQNGSMPMTMAVPRIVITFETEQHVLSVPLPGLEIGSPDRVDAVAGPDEIAVVAEDVWRGLTGTVLCSCGVRVACEGGDEEVAFLDVVGSWNGDVQHGRCQIRAGLELPVCTSKLI